MNDVLNQASVIWNAFPLWVRATLVLGAGTAAALLSRLLISVFLKLIRFDKVADRVGVSEFLRKGGVVYTASRLVGVLGFWSILIATFVEVSRMLDLGFITSVFSQFTRVLPGVLAAVLVGIVGWIVIVFMANFAVTIARNAGFLHSKLLGKVIRWLGVILVAILALEQIEVGGGIFGTILLICFAALALGLALAFGLGCKDLARDVVVRFMKNMADASRNSHKTDLEG